VLENATRHIEAGMLPVAAALASAQEVGFTVVSMSLSLIAVFIPILFMGDIVGRLFREFALTLSAAILLSLVVSLTLTPMMCARLLKQQEKSVLHRRSELLFETVRGAYGRSLGWALRHPLPIVALFAAAIGLNVYLYIAIPKGLSPEQDTRLMMSFNRADQTTSSPAMQEKMSQMVQLVLADVASDQETRGLQATLGIDRVSAARLGVTPDLIDTTLGNAFGQAIVSTIYTEKNQYRVVMEVDPRFAQGPEALKDVYVITPG